MESKRGKSGRKSPKQSKSLVGVQEDEKMFWGEITQSNNSNRGTKR